MKIEIIVFKESGKFYTSEVVEADRNIPMYKDEFIEFVKNNIPARIGEGYIVVRDYEDNQTVHQALYPYKRLFA